MPNIKLTWKRQDNILELKQLLQKHGSLSFGVLREKLGVSEPTLTEYIKLLEERKEIEAFVKPENRAAKYYRITLKSQKTVNSQLGRYEAIKFLEGIPNPVYSFRKEGSRAIASFISVSATMNRKELEKANQSIIKGLAFRLFRVPKLKTGQKMAVVIMVEGEGVKP